MSSGTAMAGQRLRQALRAIWRAREGVSAVEFGFIAPVLLLTLGGAAELSSAVTAANRATYVVDAIAEMVSRSNQTLTSDDLRNFAVSGALINPDIVRYAQQSGLPVEQAFKVTITSVQFTQKVPSCTQSCQYDASVVFSYTLNGSKRACGSLNPVQGASTDSNSLPADLFGSGTLVVVDLEANYRPLRLMAKTWLDQTVTFKRSSYFRPRYVSRINSNANCPGY